MLLNKKLSVLNFLQFFIWGTWLISAGKYLSIIGFTGLQIGAVFSTIGFAALIMPAIVGVLADRIFNSEKLLGSLHFIGAVFMVALSQIKDPQWMFFCMLGYTFAYMPTISLVNAVSFRLLSGSGQDVQKVFPPIRVWGTVGFIVAMWVVDLTGLSSTNFQFIAASISSVAMGAYCFILPACPPSEKNKKSSFKSMIGVDALVLFKQERMVVFFLFSMLLGAALQITNVFGSTFLMDFKDSFPNSFVVKHDLVLLSLSQVSETLFILTIPFFLKRFGIKIVMVLSIAAWVLRFGFFAIGDPDGGLIFLILSMIVYGMAFDFFNISGSLFVEQETPSTIRASAQGLFMSVTNGVGAIVGGLGSGLVIDHFTINGVKDWPSIWFAFAGYAFILLVFFPLMFKYRHSGEEEMDEIKKRM
jgi:NHS family xanthosine MFS transporter